MDVWLVSAKQEFELCPDTGVVVEPERKRFIPLAQDARLLDDAVIVYSYDDRGGVALMVGEEVFLTVNGNGVTGGLYRVDSNSLVRLRKDQTDFSVAIIFDDSVLEVPAASTCDICGQKLAEAGKEHCRKKLCIECIEVFGAKCPDCGRELIDLDSHGYAISEMREFLVE